MNSTTPNRQGVNLSNLPVIDDEALRITLQWYRMNDTIVNTLLNSGAGRDICHNISAVLGFLCASGTTSSLIGVSITSGMNEGQVSYMIGIVNTNNNARLSTAATFMITLPSGVASGGNDLSESVSICVHAGDISDKVNGDGSGGCTANS